MAITVQMIEKKEFRIKDSGYDPEEVDEFLDEICDEMEALQHEIQTLRSRAAQQPAAAAPAPAASSRGNTSSNAYQEENVRTMLVNAQRVCDETMANATSRANEMVEKAKDEAEGIVSDAKREVQSLHDTMSTLRAAAADYRARFQRLVDDQAHVLKAETELFKKGKD